jgi:ElaB/YqjD/DUF883 family membrane-anchored ribosome-binding protein
MAVNRVRPSHTLITRLEIDMALSKTIETRSANGNGAHTALELEEQVEALKAEIAALTKSLGSLGSGKLDEYRAGIDRLAAEAVDASLKAVDYARSEATSLEQSFERQVREHPLQAIGIAAGIGFLFALMTRRS